MRHRCPLRVCTLTSCSASKASERHHTCNSESHNFKALLKSRILSNHRQMATETCNVSQMRPILSSREFQGTQFRVKSPGSGFLTKMWGQKPTDTHQIFCPGPIIYPGTYQCFTGQLKAFFIQQTEVEPKFPHCANTQRHVNLTQIMHGLISHSPVARLLLPPRKLYHWPSQT